MKDTMTTTADQAATHTGDDDYQADVTFDASPEMVFDALTTVTGLASWWTAVTGSGTQGGELRFVFSGAAHVEGLMLAEEPLLIRVDTARRPSEVRWTVLECVLLPDWVGTSLHFELAPQGNGGCALRFRHQGVTPRLENYAAYASAWGDHLASLHAYVETGHGHPFGSAHVWGPHAVHHAAGGGLRSA
jgi:uncharacterized protein YndB with AHSA1/START domain